MATAQDIIDAGLRELNVLASGETPTAIERADGLVKLNRLVSSLNAEGIIVPYVSEDSIATTGSNVYTIGTGGQMNTTRPLALKAVTLTAGAVERPAELVTAEEWTNMSRDVSRTGKFAKIAWFSPGSPTLATIKLWPTPAVSGTLVVYSLKPLSQFALLSTTVTLPEGYERMLVVLLAMEFAPEYGAKVPEVLMASAQGAKAAIIGLNAAVLGTPPSQAQQEAQPAQ